MSFSVRSAVRTAAFRSPILAAALALGAAACDDSPTRNDDPAQGPANPIENQVVRDVSGTLEATQEAFDTFLVSVPANTVLGLILEAEDPLHVQWGPRSWREKVLTPGGTFAAVIDDVSGRIVELRVRQGDWENLRELPYRIRVVAVPQEPEQTAAEIGLGETAAEWIDPPLDVDVFTFELAAGERFYVESESDADDGVTVRVQTPGGAGYVALVETGPVAASSQVFQADASGVHRLIVTSAGLRADAATRYRVTVRPEAEE